MLSEMNGLQSGETFGENNMMMNLIFLLITQFW